MFHQFQFYAMWNICCCFLQKVKFVFVYATEDKPLQESYTDIEEMATCSTNELF